MIFTQEQIDEIKQRLSLRGIKDSELDKLDLLKHPLTGKEVITIVKDGENLRISVEDLYEEFTKYIEQSGIKEDFFNVSAYLGRLDPEFKNAAKPCTLREAVNACPPYIRKAGQMISFLDSYNMKWKTYQYIGTEDDNWEDIDLFEADVTVLQDRVDNLKNNININATKITNLEERVTTNTEEISDLKNNKANYTDILDGTISAAHSLVADKSLNADNATNADFAARARQAMMADTATLANAAQTAYNVKAENVKGVLTEDKLPPYPTDMTMEITDYRESTDWQDVVNGNSVGEAIGKIASNVRIVKEIAEKGGVTDEYLNKLKDEIKTELKEYIDKNTPLKAVEDDDDNPTTNLGFDAVVTDDVPDMSNVFNF